jgi:hypothetical protein
MKNSYRRIALTGASALVVGLWGQAASAATGTQAGLSVNNTASVAYSVGGVSQTPVASNNATFVVDRKANVMVAEVGGAATAVSFGQTNQVTTFTVTNTTNATQDFRLFALNRHRVADPAGPHRQFRRDQHPGLRRRQRQRDL